MNDFMTKISNISPINTFIFIGSQKNLCRVIKLPGFEYFNWVSRKENAVDLKMLRNL